MPGYDISGDAVFVDVGATRTLVAVVDGLGHGPKAADASDAAVSFIAEHMDLPLSELFPRCHRAIMSTRGVVMGIASIEHASRTMSFAGVGNIDVSISGRSRNRPISQPGVIGARFRRVLPTTHEMTDGDLIVMHSDGISSRYSFEDFPSREPDAVADFLIARYAKDHDDASCAVVAV